ncbi:hypothetical protein WDU94_012297 [Cyamophila willieti]
MAIAICRGYRTISTPASQVVAGVIPIDIMVRERSMSIGASEEEKIEARIESIEEWNSRWAIERRGMWTKKLIPDAYLCHKIKKIPSPVCRYCEQEDTAEHTMFHCRRWRVEREETERNLNQVLTPDNLISIMLASEEGWGKIRNLADGIMRQKEEDERQAERERE